MLTLVVALATAPAQAQTRPIPETAKLAKLKLGVFPEAELDGRKVTLGPGARIFNRDNMLVVPASLMDVTSVVAYVTGSLGEIVTVWILNDAEVKQIRARAEEVRLSLGDSHDDPQAVPAHLRLPDERIRQQPDEGSARRRRRHHLTDDPAEADIVLFNTCSVREKAQEKVFSDLGRIKALKREQARPDHRRRRLRGEPGRRRDRVARALCRRGVRTADAASAAGADQQAPRAPAGPRSTSRFRRSRSSMRCRRRAREGVSAFVSIMEGCSKYCSFCVVPYTRGEEVSRPFDDVLTEVAQLAAPGRARGDAARPERQRLSRQGRRVRRAGRLRAAARVRARDPRHRAHPLHHLASARVFASG